MTSSPLFSLAQSSFFLMSTALGLACGGGSEMPATSSDATVEELDAAVTSDRGTVRLFDATLHVIEAGVRDSSIDVTDCLPGRYVGKYTCEGSAFPEGPLEFVLAINEKPPGPGCFEFCETLVVKEGTGTLRGDWTVVAFEGNLQGGLDCKTGVFKASVINGVWGLPPAAPGGHVVPLDTFEATITANYGKPSGSPERIDGRWSIKAGVAAEGCTGDVRLQLEAGDAGTSTAAP
ncbi:MAG: hypothetical protein JWN48_1788 [Myxococcaceae bacterium]|nr:hypothetical protein [Myxococcaceae bacterium]